MMLALGAIIAALSIPIGLALSIFVPLSNGVILVFGLLLLLNINPFKHLPQVQAPLHTHPIASAFTYGLLYGPIALPCSGPLVVGIFAFSATAGDVASQLLSFLWFGLGFGLPLLLLSFISASSQRGIARFFAMNARLVNIMAGLLLVTIAVVDLYRNWDLIGAYL
jgi:cytochrome c-type biogenesis protein